MALAEDEKLFVSLCLFQPSQCEVTKKLVEYGYLDRGLRHTPKAVAFKKRFVNERKERLYHAMLECGNDMETAMSAVGLTDYAAFLFIGDELYKEGLFIRDEYSNYRAV